jgi:hypothetical protein
MASFSGFAGQLATVEILPEKPGGEKCLDSGVFARRLPLYFARFLNHFKRSMTRRFFAVLILTAFWAASRIFAHADEPLAQSAVLENNVAYLRVSRVDANLAAEIQSAQNTLATTNKIIGTVLDLRFADGGDSGSANAAADLFADKKLPLAILANGETRGAAATLAENLRAARVGLIFGSSKEFKPDIAVDVKIQDEKKFLENPYAGLSTGETNVSAGTNDFSEFIDHTSEADLVRAKVKDGDEDESLPHAVEPPKPFIHDPVLARAVDLIKGLAVVRQSRS